MTHDQRYGPTNCTICKGHVCLGGGYKLCFQRDKHSSCIAGIVDTYGGVRVIVTYDNKLKYHVRPDETLVKVPGIRVHTPIGWHDIAGLIGRVNFEVSKWADSKPNDPNAAEAAKMYKLRCLEQSQRSLDLYSIVET